MGRYEIVIYHSSRELLTLTDLAVKGGVHPDVLISFVEYGLLEPVERLGSELYFGVEDVSRLRMIQRLRADMGVNLAGVAVILDLTDKLRRLQGELEWARGIEV